jgi:hypothetical protein
VALDGSYMVSNQGLHITLPLIACGDGCLAVLDCRNRDCFTGPLALHLVYADELAQFTEENVQSIDERRLVF